MTPHVAGVAGADDFGFALAVDIGGTKMAAALVASDGAIRAHRFVPTPRAVDGDVVGSDDIWRCLADLVRTVLARGGGAPVTGVGIGCAGPIDLTSASVSPVNIEAWRRFPLVERLADLVPGVPVRLAGDGMC